MEVRQRRSWTGKNAGDININTINIFNANINQVYEFVVKIPSKYLKIRS